LYFDGPRGSSCEPNWDAANSLTLSETARRTVITWAKHRLKKRKTWLARSKMAGEEKGNGPALTMLVLQGGTRHEVFVTGCSVAQTVSLKRDIPSAIRITTTPNTMLLMSALLVSLKPKTNGEMNSQIPTRIWKIIHPIRVFAIIYTPSLAQFPLFQVAL